jgi:predicted transcriptional regulator
MKYRSRTDICSQILEAANGGTTKTKIMYKAYLSYAQLKEYLSVLIENRLLEYVEGQQLYRTSEKGLQFLRSYAQMSDMTGPMVELKV